MTSEQWLKGHPAASSSQTTPRPIPAQNLSSDTTPHLQIAPFLASSCRRARLRCRPRRRERLILKICLTFRKLTASEVDRRAHQTRRFFSRCRPITCLPFVAHNLSCVRPCTTNGTRRPSQRVVLRTGRADHLRWSCRNVTKLVRPCILLKGFILFAFITSCGSLVQF